MYRTGGGHAGAVFASCLQSPSTTSETGPGEAQRPNGAEPTGEARQESGGEYESKDFPFVVVVKDDGKDDAGGWQAAEKTFHFMESSHGIPVHLWKCRIRIEMPIRSEVWGPITPSRAALYSAEVATAVVNPLLHSRPNWKNMGDDFCRELKDRMKATFDEQYPKLGVKVRLNP